MSNGSFAVAAVSGVRVDNVVALMLALFAGAVVSVSAWAALHVKRRRRALRLAMQTDSNELGVLGESESARELLSPITPTRQPLSDPNS